MALIAYRPELENPRREGSVGFAFKGDSDRLLESVTLQPGVNRDIADDAWQKIKLLPSAKALIKIGAIEELKSKPSSEEKVEKGPENLQDVMGLSILDAVKVIESSFDEDFLSRWKIADGRATIVNKISARLSSLRDGKG